MRIGIRADSVDRNGWLRELLAEYVVEDDDIAPNYSVSVSHDRSQLNLLYWGGCLVARTRELEDLVDAIAVHLGGHRRPPTGVVRFAGSVIGDQSRAAALVGVDHVLASRVAGRLGGRAVAVTVAPWVDVDVAAQAVVLPEPLQVGVRPAPSVAKRPELATVGISSAVVGAETVAEQLRMLLYERSLRGAESDLNAARDLLKGAKISRMASHEASELAIIVREALGV